jgi:hypothetical protein
MNWFTLRVLVPILLGFALRLPAVTAQQVPFDVRLEALDIPELPGVQSFAWGHHQQYWVIIGGRSDGLHRRQPPVTFDVPGHNTQIIVVDPLEKKHWAASLSVLPPEIREPLSATNMQFHQIGEYLYLIGGYGYSAMEDDHTTYPSLTVVHVPALIGAVRNGEAYAHLFRQVRDARFAVTGGYLGQIGDTLYLVGGQRFEGRYNPMGPDHGPGFVQEYTNAIRRFLIEDDETDLLVTHLPELYDSLLLHRRDYNVVAQIMPDGREGLTAFSGVFQYASDVPWLDAVNISSEGYALQPGFTQYYNHYHCANIALFRAEKQEMHSVFFGGIAQYYQENGVLVQDDEVPFVRTIARVTRDASGNMAEYKLPLEMPALLGAGSEFIPVPGLPRYGNGVVDLDALGTADTILLGYIFGGIESSAPNIFFINDGSQSEASARVYRVWLHKEISSSRHELNAQSVGTLRLQILPNPSDGDFGIRFHLPQSERVMLRVFDASGKVLMAEELPDAAQGENTFRVWLRGQGGGGVYLVVLETPGETATQKVIIHP